MDKTPTIALSIRQPWAWLIVHGFKDIENRNWYTTKRGRILVHAAKGMTANEYEAARSFAEAIIGSNILPPLEALQRGGIIGNVEIYDCVSDSRSPWFVGEYGFALRNAKTQPFEACRGQLGFFNASVTQELF